MLNIKKFWEGLRIVAKTVLSSDTKGELEVDDTSGKLNYHNGTTRSPIVTESHTATLTGKTIDADDNTIVDLELDNLKAGVLNIDTGLAGASDTQVPSALAVKTYVDNSAGPIADDVADLVTLTGVAAGSTDLGTFTGITIPDGSDIKEALQALETEADNMILDVGDLVTLSGVPANSPDLGTFTGNTIPDDSNNKEALQALETATETTATALSTHEGLTAAHGATGAVVGTTNTQTLSNKTLTSPILNSPSIVTPSRADVKQDTKANLTTYALTASNGQLVFATDTKEMFQVVDTLLVAVGSGGVGNVDALLTQTFDTSALSDFTQTGLVLSALNPVNGDISAQLIHQPASSQSFKQVISVDRKYRGQLMTLSLQNRSSSTEGNLTLLVTDETNAVTIAASQSIQTDQYQVATATTTNASTTVGGFSNVDINSLEVGMSITGAGIPTATVINSINTTANTIVISQAATASATITAKFSALPTRRTFSFTIPENCASMSYTITALQEAGLPESYIDDVVIELANVSLLETSVTVPVITAWQAYTPTFTGFGTPSSVQMQWRQNGENVELRGKFTSGTPTATEARISLPNGYSSADSSSIPSIQIAGTFAKASMATFFGLVLAEPSVPYVTLGFQATGTAGLSKINGDSAASVGHTLSIQASVPVTGLSATSEVVVSGTQAALIQNPDSMIRVDTVNGYGSTNTCIRRFTNVTQSIGSAVMYTDSATLGASFTVATAGVYSISYSDTFSSAANMGISKNCTTLTTGIATIAISERLATSAAPSANLSCEASWTGYLAAGDIIRPHADTTTSGSPTAKATFTITSQGALKVASVNADQKMTIPTSELRFEGSSSRGAVATAIVKFDTLAKIRGDAFTVTNTSNDGTYVTMTKAGVLSASASIYFFGTGAVGISKNQATLTALPVNSEYLAVSAAQGSNDIASASWTGKVEVGDIIRVSSTTNPSNTGTYNTFVLAFQEQSVQVSVSNTLPQFSESDSSVRVDTANGYGSTATKIRRFSNVRENLGVDVEYADSATNGASFTAKTSGVYDISYSDNFTSASNFGLSKNSASLSTNISSLSSSEVLICEYASTASGAGSVSWSGYLIAGDVIRPHSLGTAAGSSFVTFTMSKVGKPNVTGVNVTPFVNIPQPTSQSLEIVQTASFANTTLISGSPTKAVGSGIFSYNTSTGTYTVLKACNVNVNAHFIISANAGTKPQIRVDGSVVAQADSNPVIGYAAGASYSGQLNAGQTFDIRNGGNTTTGQWISVLATALSDQILTAPETFSSDTAPLTYANAATYTPSTLPNAPIGTYITHTFTGSSNTKVQTTGANRPTQTDADMNVNGIFLTPRAWAATGSSATPSVFQIQIGKGHKGWSAKGYTGSGKTGNLQDWIFASGSSTEFGTLTHYNPTTGILTIDAGTVYTTNTTKYSGQTEAGQSQTTSYWEVNASKNPALVGVPQVQPRIATISDVKASGTEGGTATSGSYQTRTLNTLVDSTGIVTSLSSNQFTLPAGTYYIDATAPAYGGSTTMVSRHKAKLRNVTDSTDTVIGSSERVSTVTAVAVSTQSRIAGEFTITSSKTFEIQHRVETTAVTAGFGSAVGFGDNEVYSIVKITKVK